MAIGDSVMNIDEQLIGSMAEAMVKITNKDGEEERYQLFNLINFESSIKITTKKKGLLGRTGKVTYPTGWEGTWKAQLSYNFPIFRKLLNEFQKTGKFPSFEIIIVNENTTGTIGRQSVTHTGCYIDSAILSKIDVDTEDELKEDISGTFNGFEIAENFAVMDGMKQ